MNNTTHATTSSADEQRTSQQLEDGSNADAEAEAQAAEVERTRRERAEAWREYKATRSRLMHSIVYERGSVAATDSVAHVDLTEEERADLVERRIRAAQFAWSVFQDAERAYAITVYDDGTAVEFRQP